MPQNQSKKDISHKVLFPRVARAVRTSRLQTKWSQTDVSMKMGWKNGQFMSNIERGLCSVPAKYLSRLCQVLNVHPDAIIDCMVEDYRATLRARCCYSVPLALSPGLIAITASEPVLIQTQTPERRFFYPSLDSGTV